MSKTIIPMMPEDLTWTKDQWKAIWAKDQDILVAAAAGSGKTAVLVNRIIEKILSEADPMDVDELLVVTFTNAAAAEMRHRISDAIEQAISKNPASEHLRKQLSLINRASISTLHSFCLEVIRQYYYAIDIDPAFRIADATEAELLRDEVMEDLFEEHYGNTENDSFFALVDAFTNDRSDDHLQVMIRTLHEFSRSHPNPNQWLDEIVAMYDIEEKTKIEQLPFYSSLSYSIDLKLDEAKDLLESALELTKVPGGPAPRAETYLNDLEIVEKLIKAKAESWDTLSETMNTVKFTTAKRCSGEDFIKDIVDEAAKMRDKAKKCITDLKSEFFSRKTESYIRDIRELKSYIEMLVALVKQFDAKFTFIKTEKNVVDFSDLEHYCLAILADEEGNPSEVAKAYQKQFREVLVDEYQDVNLVQEAILKLLTVNEEYHGNMFMVGDVKQSIYRFRLAEPNLFLGKYSRFTQGGEKSGLRIDLNQNFRSRKEVLAGTNFLFQQIMGMTVGEIHYDEDAQLKQGAPYPEDKEYPIELHLINGANGNEKNGEAEEDGIDFETEELDKAQLEAREMAKLIKKMVNERQPVYDMKTKQYRSIQYRDIVVLLRSMPWAPQIIDEFKQQGIPAYASLSTGYFEATEVAIMLELLKVIDNPQQDIPLAAVLRSPIVGLDEEQLARIRIFHTGNFYEALTSYYRQGSAEDTRLYEMVASFYTRLLSWRQLAKQVSLSDLVWTLYRETRFYDFVGGMPGGKQRQANLRALYDRARQYEKSSFRGLFRFLRFIERMQDRGDDLGAAKALGEQEDVVRLMTIHSSKGLEFPVVFIAGLSKQFNMMDLNKPYLLDKELGFATKYVHPQLRITYPSLPQLAFKRKKKMELIAEEMRVLYVALTRAKEKVHLIASVPDIERSLQDWQGKAVHSSWLLKDYVRASAKSYLDWIGPALMRHQDSRELCDESFNVNEDIYFHSSRWIIHITEKAELEKNEEEDVSKEEEVLEQIKQAQKLDVSSAFTHQIAEQLNWQYPHHAATVYRSKQSVTDLKRLFEERDEKSGADLIGGFSRPIVKRPSFMQEKFITPAERGTITHLIMQHVPLDATVTLENVESLIADLLKRELITEEQQHVVDRESIVQFFESTVGQRLLKANDVRREVPFTLFVQAKEIYMDWQGEDERILVQGMIDCLFEDENGLVLLDFKTDSITNRFRNGFEGAKEILAKRYDKQLELYSRAVEDILKKKVDQRYLFFFDGAHVMEV